MLLILIFIYFLEKTKIHSFLFFVLMYFLVQKYNYFFQNNHIAKIGQKFKKKKKLYFFNYLLVYKFKILNKIKQNLLKN